MTEHLSEWVLDILQPERRRRKFHALLRQLDGVSPTRPDFSDLVHDLLRRADDRMLGEVWREWKDAGRNDLALEAEREMERRKAHSIGRS